MKNKTKIELQAWADEEKRKKDALEQERLDAIAREEEEQKASL